MSEETYDDVVIGLEIHIHLNKLKTKLFCGCSTDYHSAQPNTYTCSICLGHPGTLPVLNKNAIETAIKLALALKCKISPLQYFYRKNYFYPDMSKNFQISQYNKGGGVPFGNGGEVLIQIGDEKKVIPLDRIHLEEDPGKLVHQGSVETSPYTLVDYNRNGVALIEIVTTPCMKSPKEARAYCNKLKSILVYADINDPSEEGAFRVDANVSIKGHERVEVKNIGSVKDVEKALHAEIKRMRKAIQKGQTITRDTRHFDGEKTILLRSKEQEDDYRYFPEPDLTKFEVTEDMIKKVKKTLLELPDDRKERFIKDYGMNTYDSEVLIQDKALADFFEQTIKQYNNPKEVVNWLINDVMGYLNDNDLELKKTKFTVRNFVRLLKMIDEEKFTKKVGKQILKDVINGKNPESLAESKKLEKISDEALLSKLCDEVIAENQDVVQKLATKPKAFQALVGEVMKKTKGMADYTLTQDILKKKLNLQ